MIKTALVLSLILAACAGKMTGALYCPVVEAPYHYPEAAWSGHTEGVVEIDRCPKDSGFPPVTVVSGPKILADSIVHAKERLKAPAAPASAEEILMDRIIAEQAALGR